MSPQDRTNLPHEPGIGQSRPPLPDHFEPELHRLDEAVGDELRREYAANKPSADLIERVYEASVGGLPVRPRLRLVGARPLPAARRVARLVTTGRLAAAAAILLAVLISVPFAARHAGNGNGGQPVAANGNGQPTVSPASNVPASYALSPELQLILSETLATEMNDFSYLIETKDATLAELNDELLDVFDALESGPVGSGWDTG